jgi:protein arginine kinase activator
VATFHITELTGGGKPQELHLCEDHARQYLTQPDAESTESAGLAGMLAQQMGVGQTAEDLTKLDQRACPMCGITFFEFRNQGRLGCPHDYVFFEKDLEPLILNIHGAMEHQGKKPQGYATGTEDRTRLIQLRRELREAIQAEEYEKASKIRDDIRQIETEKKNS